MTLDSLVAAIKASSPEEPAQKLAHLLTDWKNDDSSVEELETTIKRFIGYTWFSSNALHNEICGMWSDFLKSSIQGIHGMTMNERLCSFGLTERFESATTDSARQVVYAKLLARA